MVVVGAVLGAAAVLREREELSQQKKKKKNTKKIKKKKKKKKNQRHLYPLLILECSATFTQYSNAPDGKVLTCPRVQSLRGVTLEDCRKRACYLDADTFSFLEQECHLCNCSLGLSFTYGEGGAIYTLPSVTVTPEPGTSFLS